MRYAEFKNRNGLTAAARIAAGAALVLTAAAHAQYSGRQQSAPATALEITECIVYSDRDATRRHDCTAKAKELCSKSGRTCELPIGLVLTGGRDIDGDPQTWEKVRVRYSCGVQQRINGPHHQNDHASMILSCAG